MTIYLPAALIFLAAGFVQGLTGFGSALVAIPLLSLVIDVKAAVPLCILNGLLITVYLAVQLRRYLDHRKILPLVIGSIPGVFVGTTLLTKVDPSVIRIGIGCLLISYSFYNLLVYPRPLNPARIWGYVAGFLTGTIGAAFSAGGPPTLIYTTMTDWKKEEIKATLSGFFVVNGIVTAVVHAMSGVSSLTTVGYFAATAPFVLIGTVAGASITGRIDRKTYLRFIYGFLLVMGVVMLAG